MTRPQTPDRVAVESLLHQRHQQGLPGLSKPEIAQALGLAPEQVHKIIHNIGRAKNNTLAVDKSGERTRYSLQAVYRMPSLGPLSGDAIKKITPPSAGAAVEVIWPSHIKPTVLPAPAYQTWRGGSAPPLRPGALNALACPSLASGLRSPYRPPTYQCVGTRKQTANQGRD